MRSVRNTNEEAGAEAIATAVATAVLIESDNLRIRYACVGCVRVCVCEHRVYNGEGKNVPKNRVRTDIADTAE